MSSTPKKYMTGLSQEEKVKRRQEQLRQSQLKYREKHGLIKPKLTEEEKEQRRKEKAHERYLKNREAKKGVEELPVSYTVDYRRNYHKQYYAQHKEVLLNRSKERYTQKAVQQFPVSPESPMTLPEGEVLPNPYHSDN